ncbi:MAG TPA: carboxypeptidase-like regulatory domain-containing protein, partial [Salinimicrobium sp.]|nr:carboxypeptidase-like regulatory domain-containing protein [Salinimicrobium sp.]
MKKIFFIFLLFGYYISASAQITGTVTNASGEALPYVNIYLEGSFTGTTTNENGDYELEVSEPGKYVVNFQFLGYKTEKREISVASFPFELDVQLTQESTTLEEVVINSGENPANRIMRNAIEKR